MTVAAVKTRKWTREEYYQLAEAGYFQGQRVELIDGEIIEMAPQNNWHAVTVGLAQRALQHVFGDDFWIRCQMPLFLGHGSEPEPDLAIVTGTPNDWEGTDHPRTALLVVEVSDTSLMLDRRRKANLYAAAGIQDYWIINIPQACIEVHRQPAKDVEEPGGARYQEVSTLGRGQSIAPIARPDHAIDVSTMLVRRR